VDFTPTIHHDTYPTIAAEKVDMTGKVVVISGASKGIGKACALSYAKAGVSGMVIMARSDLSSVEEEIISAACTVDKQPPTILSLKVDTTKRSDLEAATKAVSSTFGKVDILVNNAGYLETFVPIADSDPDDWWYTFQVNLNGVYMMTKFFLPLVLKSDLKTVIMMSSIAAHITNSGASAYTLTKVSILRMCDFLTEEYGGQGLLAYGIHPGVSCDREAPATSSVHANIPALGRCHGPSFEDATSYRRLAKRYGRVGR
jgi:NAD(P)-dependent dehydrogenase (short-subunit alcohol dehydrogenase family)